MRPALILLLILFCSNAFAQNWQMFPLDSLRYYTNPIEDSVFIRGIDFRQYERKKDTTIIDLGWFARLDTFISNGFIHYLKLQTSNSNFGKWALVTDSFTELKFVESHAGKIPTTTFRFKNKAHDSTFLVLDDDRFYITSKTQKLTKNGNDSLRTDELMVFNKKDKSTITYQLILSKKFGLVKSPVWFDLITLHQDIRNIKEVEFFGFKEMTFKEFFKPEIGSEFHFSDSDTRYKSVVGKWTCTGLTGNLGKFKIELEGVQYIPGPYPYTFPDPTSPYRLSSVDTEMELGTQIKNHPTMDSDIFNLIPTKIYSDTQYWSVSGALPQYRVMCSKLVKHQQGNIEYFYSYGDSAIFIQSGYDQNRVTQSTQGFGVTNLFISAGTCIRCHSHFITQYYFKTSNGCEFAESEWRYTGIEEPYIEEPLKLYPNPCKNVLIVESQQPILSIHAFNISGQKTNLDYSKNEVNVSSLTNGIYNIEIVTSRGISSQKIMVNR